MFKDKREIDELPEDSCDIFKRNMVDRYINRPNRAFAVENIVCWITFVMLNF